VPDPIIPHADEQEIHADLFSVVRLLSILGNRQYNLAGWSSASKSKFETRKLLFGALLSLPAIIQMTSSRAGEFVKSVLYSELSKMIAILLAGAGATNFFEVLQTELGRPRPVVVPVSSPQREAEIVRGAILLKQVIPDSVAKEIAKRVAKCWWRYQKLLEGDYLPEEVEQGTEQLKNCICKEVLRLQDLNGGELPESDEILHAYMFKYRCQERLSPVTEGD
jgi:hypothetical protein